MSPYYYERPRIFYRRKNTPIRRYAEFSRYRLMLNPHRQFSMQYIFHHKAEVFEGWMLYHKYHGTDTMFGKMLEGVE